MPSVSPLRATFESSEIVPLDKSDDELSSKNSESLTVLDFGAGLATGEKEAMPVQVRQSQSPVDFGEQEFPCQCNGVLIIRNVGTPRKRWCW